jgi:hypothetical protein
VTEPLPPAGPAGPADLDVPGHPVADRPVAAAPAARPRRRWPWVVALLLVLGLAGAAAGVAWDQREVAASWQARATGLEAQRDAALARTSELEAELDELLTSLETSEVDVAALEARLRELADEKAQAEDAVVTGEVEREVLRELSTRVTGAVEALDACVTRLFELQRASVDAFNLAAAGEVVDVEPLNAQATETTAFCNEARTAAANAGAAADQLLGP